METVCEYYCVSTLASLRSCKPRGVEVKREEVEEGGECELTSFRFVPPSPSLVDPPNSYKGTSDLQLERISVYYNEASGQSRPRFSLRRSKKRNESSSSLPFSISQLRLPIFRPSSLFCSWKVRTSSGPRRSRAWNHGLHPSWTFGELVPVSFELRLTRGEE